MDGQLLQVRVEHPGRVQQKPDSSQRPALPIVYRELVLSPLTLTGGMTGSSTVRGISLVGPVLESGVMGRIHLCFAFLSAVAFSCPPPGLDPELGPFQPHVRL